MSMSVGVRLQEELTDKLELISRNYGGETEEKQKPPQPLR
jgi:hypothetical protein